MRRRTMIRPKLLSGIVDVHEPRTACVDEALVTTSTESSTHNADGLDGREHASLTGHDAGCQFFCCCSESIGKWRNLVFIALSLAGALSSAALSQDPNLTPVVRIVLSSPALVVMRAIGQVRSLKIIAGKVHRCSCLVKIRWKGIEEVVLV